MLGISKDIYVYSGTDVLINKHHIKDPDKLQDLESLIFIFKDSQPLPKGRLDYDHLKAIHQHYFGELYEWAGQERKVDIIKGYSHFARKEFITKEIHKVCDHLKNENYLTKLEKGAFCHKAAHYFNEINAIHPFREGNGRTLRSYFTLLSNQAGYNLEWSKIDREAYIQANILGFNGDNRAMAEVFQKIASPLEINLKNEISISQYLREDLKKYLTLQMDLAACVEKNDLQKANQLRLEAQKQAKKLVCNVEFKNLAGQNLELNPVRSNKPRAKLILERLEKQEISEKDLKLIFQQANRQVLKLECRKEKSVGLKI